MSIGVRRTIFALFLISGFCGLLYQVIWIRLAYASFGIITSVMSVVISVFMLGLLLGSAFGGPVAKKLVQRFRISAILLYALAEFLIGLGAFCVPRLFVLEQHWLLALGSMNSVLYLSVSGIAIGVALLPWCILMGFTYPFMMTFVRETDAKAASSFSFLYLANVIGAMTGTIVTAAVLIELFGFAHTLAIAAVCNFLIAAASLYIGTTLAEKRKSGVTADGIAGAVPMTDKKIAFSVFVLLFATGFVSMSMEIIWTRNFTPVLRTVVYSYAFLLATYLLASWTGSYMYRKHLARSRCLSVGTLLGVLAVAGVLPLVANDPRLPLKGALTIFLSIFPLCSTLGYLTPLLVDRQCGGSPTAAGRAYAVNTLGCILGPLCAAYLFLPVWGVKASLLLLSALLTACFAAFANRSLFKQARSSALLAISVALLLAGWFQSDTYEEYFHLREGGRMQRDYAATVTCVGNTLLDKQLLVNGISMTYLTPITQFMAHLPLGFCAREPKSALDICFGMGTTFRSLVSWGISATAVELIPSVPRVFGYFWQDADSVMGNPLAAVAVDDGRRFLMRTKKKFDVITIDPPPPIEAAGSSLLYSVEMYSLIRQHLDTGGVLQQWILSGEPSTIQAAARSIAVSFPYVKVYRSVEGWGYHFLASMTPLRHTNGAGIVARMPEKARADLRTWCVSGNLEEYVQGVLSSEVPLDSLLSKDPGLMITDARPYNEYFFLRRLFGAGGSQGPLARQILKAVRAPRHVLHD